MTNSYLNPLYLYRRLRSSVVDTYQRSAYSQEGEDMILSRIFPYKQDGFYVDVGAHHPRRFSNTYLFYRRGWRGINIDAKPGTKALFDRERPRDINLEMGIGIVEGEFNYVMFDEIAYNSFRPDLNRISESGARQVGEKRLRMVPLSEVLDKYLPSKKLIDFLSIDVEGMDLEVLMSNNWQAYRPAYLLVECWDYDASRMQHNQIHQYLDSQRYEFFAKTVSTIFYRMIQTENDC